MATWERNIIYKTMVRVAINTPAVSADLDAAMEEARQQYRLHNNREPDSDDAFEILTRDDKIIIQFETSDKRVVEIADSVLNDLERATELLALLIKDCVRNNNGACLIHTGADERGRCHHQMARDFLTNKEENPYG